MVVPSLDISQFIIDIVYDLSGDTPQICLTPASIGAGQAGVKYNYKITSASGILVHNNTNWTTPDAVGNGDEVCFDLPQWNGTLPWSGSDYVVIATMKDTANLEFSQTISTSICPPRGNDVAGDWYGKACINPDVRCESTQILLHDTTNYDYKGLPKTLVSKTWTVIFPADPDTGVQPAPVVITGLNDVAIPITYNGNYEARLVTVYSYEYPDGVTILIQYTTYNKETGVHIPVAVECGIDICSFLCEYKALIKSTRDLCKKGNEVEYEKSQRLLVDVTALITEINANKACGKPVGPLIAEIKRISGFKCNCDCGNNGLTPRSLILTGNQAWTFDTDNSCGDIEGTFTQVGNNILLTLSDKTYVFDFSVNAESYGFSWTRTDDGCTVTNIIDVDINTLSESILTEIAGDDDLKELFCDLVAMCTPTDPFAGVDMLCIWPELENECTYTSTLNQPHTPTDKIVSIMINGVFYYPPIEYQYDNAAQINAWLITLNLSFAGTEYVVNGTGGIVFTSTNENQISRITWRDLGTGDFYWVFPVVTDCSIVESTVKMQGLVNKICAVFNALYGDSSVLYKVKVNGDDTTPGYLGAKLTSSDGSVVISILGEQVNLQTLLKVDAADDCGGYLKDKFVSNNFQINDVKLNVYASDYVITSALYGAGYTLDSIKIDGVTYPVQIVTTNLSGIQTALNAIGLGTFTVTSPAANLVITSLGNRYTVTNAIVKTTVGPVYTTYNAVVSNTVLLGECSFLQIEPLDRTWIDLPIDGVVFDDTTQVVEYATKDSLKNVMLNILVYTFPLTSLVPGTYPLTTSAIPIGSRPRREQRVAMWRGWDDIGEDNLTNYFVIKTNGMIEVEINLAMPGTQVMQVDSIYYATN